MLIQAILIFLIVLNLLVIVHEFGHFIMAKKSGVIVKEFAIGMGPVLFKKKIKGTTFSIRAIPFGGFNDLKGETVKEKGEGNFVTLPLFKKLAVLLGGVFMNFLLAIVFIYVYLVFSGYKIEVSMPINPIVGNLQEKDEGLLITDIDKASSLPKDLSTDEDKEVFLLKVNGKDVNSYDDIQHALEDASSSARLTFKIVKDDESNIVNYDVKLLPGGKIGIAFINRARYYITYNTKLEKLLSGISYSLIDFHRLNYKLLRMVISQAKTEHDYKPLAYSVSGPVAIFGIIDSLVKNGEGILTYINITAMLSSALALFNLIPFPGLDGWHILIAILKKFFGDAISDKVIEVITVAGLIFIIILSIIIAIKDIILFF